MNRRTTSDGPGRLSGARLLFAYSCGRLHERVSGPCRTSHPQQRSLVRPSHLNELSGRPRHQRLIARVGL